MTTVFKKTCGLVWGEGGITFLQVLRGHLPASSMHLKKQQTEWEKVSF